MLGENRACFHVWNSNGNERLMNGEDGYEAHFCMTAGAIYNSLAGLTGNVVERVWQSAAR
jgi:hypothetical protein